MKPFFAILLAVLYSGLAQAQNEPASTGNLSIGVKSFANSPCAAQPKVLFEGENIELYSIIKDVKAPLKYWFYISRDNFQRRDKEMNFFDSRFDSVAYDSNARLESNCVKAGKNGRCEQTDGSYLLKAKLQLRNLQPELEYAQMTYIVIAIDANNKKSTTTGVIKVVRPVMFRRNAVPSVNCYEIEKAKPVSSMYLNQNDSPLTITITDSMTKTETERKSKNSGWSFSPTIFTAGFGISLFGYNRNYLKEVTKSVSESVYSTINNTLDPGDRGFIYSQATRFKDAYDTIIADSCGTEVNVGLSFFQRWSTNFNLVKVDPFSKDPFMQTKYGADAFNSCKQLDEIQTISVPVNADGQPLTTEQR